MCGALYESLLNWLNLKGFQRGGKLIRLYCFILYAHFTGTKRTSLFFPGPLPRLTLCLLNCYIKPAHNSTCTAVTLCLFIRYSLGTNSISIHSCNEGYWHTITGLFFFSPVNGGTKRTVAVSSFNWRFADQIWHAGCVCQNTGFTVVLLKSK